MTNVSETTTDQRQADDRLAIGVWARDLGIDGAQLLGVDLGERPTAMAHSTATGEALVSNGSLGVDVIRLAAGEGFVPHTHPGDHILVVVGGQGTITYGGRIYPSRAGEIYFVPGKVPHAVGAITDHVILAIGAPHRPVDSPDRLTVVAYDAITATMDEIHCLICDIRSRSPQRLHDDGCPHCPCENCHDS